MKTKNKYILIFLVVLLTACTSSIDSIQEYMKYLANTENGLVQTKNISGVKFTVKYLPIEYLAYRSKETKKTTAYDHTVCFMFTIGPDSTQNFDITKLGVENYAGFAERMEVMNFQMNESISMKIGKSEYKPSFSQLENNYGLKNQRTLMVVFNVNSNISNEFMKNNDIQFIYNDDLFNTGISKFKFLKDQLEELPEFNYTK